MRAGKDKAEFMLISYRVIETYGLLPFQLLLRSKLPLYIPCQSLYVRLSFANHTTSVMCLWLRTHTQQGKHCRELRQSCPRRILSFPTEGEF